MLSFDPVVGAQCNDFALILLIFAAGYGKDAEISAAFHCRFHVLGQRRG